MQGPKGQQWEWGSWERQRAHPHQLWSLEGHCEFSQRNVGSLATQWFVAYKY